MLTNLSCPRMIRTLESQLELSVQAQATATAQAQAMGTAQVQANSQVPLPEQVKEAASGCASEDVPVLWISNC